MEPNQMTIAKVNCFAIGAIGWGVLDFLLGGINAGVEALGVLIIADMLTGMWASYGSWCPSKCRDGLISKVFILAAVAIGHMVDMGTGLSIVKDVMIGGYSLSEALSICDNISRAGYGHMLPPFVHQALESVAKSKNLNVEDLKHD